jgi:hypothetical protein
MVRFCAILLCGLWLVSSVSSTVQAAPSSQFLPGPDGFLHIAGVWRGPDYVLRVNADGNARVEWFDGASAVIFFYGVTRSGQTAFGLVQAGTDSSRTSVGDQVELYVTERYWQGEMPLAPTQFTVRWPDTTPRWENLICYQGQNPAFSRYPC